MIQKEWPELNYQSWKETYQTLHRWVQIVGKVRLCHETWANHSWNSTLYVTSCGLSTSAIPNKDSNFSIEFDFLNSNLLIQSSSGQRAAIPLNCESVASFYNQVVGGLKEFGISASFNPRPNELPDDIPFPEDTRARIYNKEHAEAFFQTLVRVNNVMKAFRSRFIGKCSPVHFFWGSFDLAVTRFSGRRAPDHPGGVPHLPDQVAKEAYSHEVSSCGFWPGNDLYPHAAFYSYAYPAPANFENAKILPKEAFFHPELKEFILPYEAVRKSDNPEETLMDFFESTYAAAADLGEWNRSLLEESSYRAVCVRMFTQK